MLPICSNSWRSWTETTSIQARYNCDQTIFQKKFAVFSHQSLTHTSKTFYLIASFYLITPRHHLLTSFKKLQERTKFISNRWDQTLRIRNVFNFSQPSISSDSAKPGRHNYSGIIIDSTSFYN